MGSVFKRNGHWYIGYYYGGKRFRKKIGKDKKVAELALMDAELKMAREIHLDIVEKKEILFEVFAEEYLTFCKANVSKSSYYRDDMIVHGCFVPVWKGKLLGTITTKNIEDYKTSRLSSVKAATVNRELSTLKAMFRQAVLWDYLRKNPAKPVKFFKLPKPTFRFLSQDEIDLFLDACKRSTSQPLYPVVVTALRTGMRQGEIFHLRWEDIDFKRGIINVVSREDAQTKNYESRTIPMTPFLAETLRQYPRRLDSPYVFCKANGKPIDCLRAFRRTLTKLKKDQGIPHFRFHDLRHTFASHLVMKGVDIRTVQELIGHKDIRMTMRYAHLAPDHLKNAIYLLDADDNERAAAVGS